jgi:hypothetical protein
MKLALNTKQFKKFPHISIVVQVDPYLSLKHQFYTLNTTQVMLQLASEYHLQQLRHLYGCLKNFWELLCVTSSNPAFKATSTRFSATECGIQAPVPEFF